jgi:signal transduction histidine kinase
MGVNRATHLVQQLLMMARLEPQTSCIEMHEIDLSQVTRNILGELDSEAHKKDIELKLDAVSTHLIKGNEAAVQILIQNIISNAIRYSPNGTCVEVSISEDTGRIELCVEDNGPGISEKERNLIFERFYRGEGKQHIMGSGLGLSIVQRIAELHRAEITLENRSETVGLRFCVLFSSYS